MKPAAEHPWKHKAATWRFRFRLPYPSSVVDSADPVIALSWRNVGGQQVLVVPIVEPGRCSCTPCVTTRSGRAG